MERCLITGASRGIGRAIANRLAAPDRELLLHGRDQEALVEVYTEVENAGGRASILTCDLAGVDEIEKMVNQIGTDPLHTLINNAGIAIVKPLDALTLDDWQRTLAVNVTAPFLLTQRLIRLMPPGAGIVNILSIAAKTGFAHWSSYCMSKFALEGFSQAVREELRPKGIRLMNIYPSATATELWDGIDGDWPSEGMMPAVEVAEAVAYALNRPAKVLVETIDLGGIQGTI
jgi:short-subunit dehydrogenase